MAKLSFNLIIFAALLSLLLVFSMVESRTLLQVVETVTVPATPTCKKVYGVETGDTCFDIAQKFSLTSEAFESINPNLVCNRLFPGQWICISGVLN